MPSHQFIQPGCLLSNRAICVGILAFSLSVDWIQLRVPGHNITHKRRQVQPRRLDHRRNDRTALFYRKLKYIPLPGLHPIPSWSYRVMCSASGYSLRLHVLSRYRDSTFVSFVSKTHTHSLVQPSRILSFNR